MKLLLILLLLVSMVGCYSPRYVYSPAAHNTPVLTVKNDSKLGINYSSNILQKARGAENTSINKGGGLDVQGAYAITKKIAVQAAYSWRSEKNEGNFTFTSVDSSIIYYRRNLTEAGIGYYTKTNSSGTVWLQVFAGVGIGEFRFKDIIPLAASGPATRFYKTHVTKFYLQPAIMTLYKKRISAAFSSRFSILKFSKVKTDYTDEELINYKLNSVAYSPVVFWEPAFLNSFEFKKLPGVKLEYQFGLSLLVSKRFLDARAFNFSAGIFADMLKLFTKNAKK